MRAICRSALTRAGVEEERDPLIFLYSWPTGRLVERAVVSGAATSRGISAD